LIIHEYSRWRSRYEILTPWRENDVQRLNLPAIVTEAIETVRSAASAKGVGLQTMIDPLNTPFSGDPN
jgi:hypothetical protein